MYNQNFLLLPIVIFHLNVTHGKFISTNVSDKYTNKVSTNVKIEAIYLSIKARKFRI